MPTAARGHLTRIETYAMTTTSTTPDDRLKLARLSLDGLSIGDGFGQRFFAPGNVGLIARREPPPPYWSYTDDTAMALAVVGCLAENQAIDQDDLAFRFAASFRQQPHRGYAHGAITLLEAINRGERWQDISPSLFDNTGSMGNGGAMRVAPVGAWFFDDIDRAAHEARLSAAVTHAHPEGQAGAAAVAVAAALAARQSPSVAPVDLFDEVLNRIPEGLTKTAIQEATQLGPTISVAEAVDHLGNGRRVVAWDTVPFCLWCAFHHLDSFEDALWTCVSAGGDVDTTAAIVGGIVSLAVGDDGIPEKWRNARESLPPL